MFSIVDNHFKKRIFGASVASIALVVGYAPGQALCQSLPAVNVVKANPITPSASEAYFGVNTIATDGLCRDYPTKFTGCGLSEGRAVAPEIIEAARALQYDPDQIFEFVRNTIDTDFLFGSHKGALGSIVEKAGTAFDQTELFVQLIREAAKHRPELGLSVQYKYGEVTLNGSEISSWTGFTEARAVCQYFANGGIPVKVNGSSNSCDLSGSASSVTFSHIWAEVTIGGQVYFFDPSIKSYQHKAPINLQQETLAANGEALQVAKSTQSSGVDSGVPWVSSLNKVGLEDKLAVWTGRIYNRLSQSSLNGASPSDVTGGHIIIPDVRGSGGWRNTRPSNYSVKYTWTNIPDQYRAKLSVHSPTVIKNYTTNAVISETDGVRGNFFVDEIYGRRLEIGSKASSPPATIDPSVTYLTSWLQKRTILDGVDLYVGPTETMADLYTGVWIDAVQPFANMNSEYSILRQVDFVQNALVLHSWGKATDGLQLKWSNEEADDRDSYQTTVDNGGNSDSFSHTSGDYIRSQIGAMWLNQTSQAAEINSSLGGGRVQNIRTIGFVASRNTYSYKTTSEGGYDTTGSGFNYIDDVSLIDADTSLALTLDSTSQSKYNAILLTIATVSASLEGSIVEHLSNVPDGVSTARRFSWDTKPDDTSPNQTSRKIYRLDQGSGVEKILSLPFLFDGSLGASIAYNNLPAVKPNIVTHFKERAKEDAVKYYNAGYNLIESSEVFAGPGHRFGNHYYTVSLDCSSLTCYELPFYYRTPSLQRGGALIANKYDGNGYIVSIAHVINNISGPAKGGGGSIVNNAGGNISTQAVELMKSKFTDKTAALGVSLSSGDVQTALPTLNSVGQGSFPNRFDLTPETNPEGLVRTYPFSSPNNSLPPLVSSLSGSVTLSSSANVGMGSSRADAMASTLASFITMQDIFSSPPEPAREIAAALTSNWWLNSLDSNVLVVRQGGSSEKYVRVTAGRYLPEMGAGYAEITGTRYAVRPSLIRTTLEVAGQGDSDPLQTESSVRYWRYNNIGIKVFGGAGDYRTYLSRGDIPDAIDLSKAYVHGFTLDKWYFPDGTVVSYDYPADVNLGGISQVHVPALYPSSIKSNLGFSMSLAFNYQSQCGSGLSSQFPSDATGAVMYGVTVPNVGNSCINFIVRDQANGVVRPESGLMLYEIYGPRDSQVPIIRYNYDENGIAKSALNANAIRFPDKFGAYEFSIISNQHSVRMDPLKGYYILDRIQGGRSLTELSAAVNSTPFVSSKVRYRDEIGRLTQLELDGGGRPVRYTYPELDQEVLSYDSRGNIIEKRRIAKPGSYAQDLVWTASYDLTCSNPKTCNKPNWIRDPNGGQTDYTYSPDHGGVLTETKPAVFDPVSNQMVRPQMRYTYTPLYASDSLVNTGGPIYKLTAVSTCRTATAANPASCVNSANESITVYAYSPNKLLLTSETVRAGDNSVSSTTTYTYDDIGNVTSVDGPLAGDVDKVYTTYDALRRPIFEIGADPDGSGVLKRAITKHTYDADSNETLTQVGTGTAVNGSDFVVTNFKRMTYDAAGQLLQTEVGQP